MQVLPYQQIESAEGCLSTRSVSTWLANSVYPLHIFVMPELSRFFGIIIRMYVETGVQHHTPHFHAYYQDEVAVFGIEPVDLISGSLPRRQQRMVEAWAELHQTELQTDWQRLQAGQSPLPVQPLS